MKKTIITLLIIFSAMCVNAQAKKDTTRTFYLIFPEKTWSELLELIKTADEKPSKVAAWQQLIVGNLRLIEQPKQDTLKQKKR